jgi:hypothetical protein
MPNLLSRSLNYISHSLTSPPADRELYDDIVRIRDILSNQIIARSKADLDFKVKKSLEAPMSSLQYLPVSQPDMRPESAEALVSSCTKIRKTIVAYSEPSQQTLVNLTALYSVCNTIIFFMSSSYDITKQFPVNPDLFRIINKVLYRK